MKNLCTYCGRKSGTNAPFPKELINNSWLSTVCPKCHSLEQIKLLDFKRTNPEEFRETAIAQHKTDKKRKMVGNGVIDLVFWFDDDDSIYGFQYALRDRDFDEIAFTWSKERGSTIHIVVVGKNRAFKTNTLQQSSELPIGRFTDEFEKASANLKLEYKSIVLEKLTEYKSSLSE